MPTIPTYRQQVDPRAPTMPRATPAPDVDPSLARGLAQAGQALEGYGRELERQRERDRTLAAANLAAEGRREMALDFDRQKQQAPAGADGFTQNWLDHADRMAAAIAERADDAEVQRRVAAQLRDVATNTVGAALSFEATERVRHRSEQVDRYVDTIADTAYLEPGAFGALSGELEAFVDELGVPDRERAGILESGRNKLAVGELSRRVERDPYGTLRALRDPQQSDPAVQALELKQRLGFVSAAEQEIRAREARARAAAAEAERRLRLRMQNELAMHRDGVAPPQPLTRDDFTTDEQADAFYRRRSAAIAHHRIGSASPEATARILEANRPEATSETYAADSDAWHRLRDRAVGAHREDFVADLEGRIAALAADEEPTEPPPPPEVWEMIFGEDATDARAAYEEEAETARLVGELRHLPMDAGSAVVAEAAPSVEGERPYQVQQQRYTMLLEELQRVNAAIAEDPGGHVARVDAGVRAAWSAVADQQEGAFTAAVAASLDAQRRLGVGDRELAPLPSMQAQRIAADITAAPPEQALDTLLATVGGLEGEPRDLVLQQLADVDDGLRGLGRIAGIAEDGERAFAAELLSVLRGEDARIEDTPTRNGFEADLARELAPLRDATAQARLWSGDADVLRQFEADTALADAYGSSLVNAGVKSRVAARRAHARLFEDELPLLDPALAAGWTIPGVDQRQLLHGLEVIRRELPLDGDWLARELDPEGRGGPELRRQAATVAEQLRESSARFIVHGDTVSVMAPLGDDGPMARLPHPDGGPLVYDVAEVLAAAEDAAAQGVPPRTRQPFVVGRGHVEHPYPELMEPRP